MPPTTSELIEELRKIENNDFNLRELEKQVLSEQGITPFVGQGVSMANGLPSIGKFVERWIENGTHTYGNNNVDSIIENIRNTIGPRAFYDAYQRFYGAFTTDHIERFILAELLPPISNAWVITTNRDHILERAFTIEKAKFEKVVWGKDLLDTVDTDQNSSETFHPTSSNESVWGERFYRSNTLKNRMLFKLCGDVDDIKSYLLTSQEQIAFYGDMTKYIPTQREGTTGFSGGSTPRFYALAKFFEATSLLYVGASLRQNLFINLLKTKEPIPPDTSHYAILERLYETDTDFESLNRHLSERNIRPIWYPKGQHAYVEAILRHLAARKSATSLPPQDTSPARPIQIIPANLPQPSVPDILVDACVENECVLYVGAGLSTAAGPPTWKALVKGLLDWASKEGYFPTDLVAACEQALAQNNIDTVADTIVSHLETRQGELAEYLRQQFLGEDKRPGNRHALLKDLNLAAVLTTNFDDLLEQTFEAGSSLFTPHDAESLLDALSKRTFFLGKFYGTLERPNTVLVAPMQYQEAVAGNVRFANFVQGLFISRTLFFIGCSLDGIETYLSGIRMTGQPNRTHFALVNVENGAWKVRADLLKRRYGIEVIAYTATEGFPEVQQFLEKLRDAVQQKLAMRQSLESAGHTETVPSWLKRVELKNIGPFESLELDLDRNWQALLGDNGQGKSTILKAIAVGICGEDARYYAGRLIRAGCTSGTITLTTDRNTTYVTEILDRDGVADVRSTPGRCLEAEGWLVLGFPPLRNVTWQKASLSRPQGKQRPTVEDLLPLVTGEVDQRADKLKEWLLNLDYQIKTEVARTSSSFVLKDPPALPSVPMDEFYEQQRTEFFDIIRRLAPGLTFEYLGIDARTHQIKVKTADGEIPIEAISQGTTSLIGWVGVLLQRLYDLYGDRDKPLESYALVLIDEIDAHMHPFWQQNIVPSLMKIFPNVQFVATTHAPLIVGGLRDSQITKLSRNIQTGKISAQQTSNGLLLMRADQILTSSLFGLGSTRADSMGRYTALLGKTDRTPAEQEEFENLKAQIEKGITTGESPLQRKVEIAVQEILDREMREIHESDSESDSIEMPPSQISPDIAFEIRRQLANLMEPEF